MREGGEGGEVLRLFERRVEVGRETGFFLSSEKQPRKKMAAAVPYPALYFFPCLRLKECYHDDIMSLWLGTRIRKIYISPPKVCM